MIERHWKGIAKADKADAYHMHLVNETFPALRKMDGFVNARILTRTVDEGVEFLIVTTWDSLKPITQFAGVNIDQAVVPDSVQEMMVNFDKQVLHYHVVPGPEPGKG